MDMISTGYETFRHCITEVSLSSYEERTNPPIESFATRIFSSYNRRPSDFDFYIKLPILITSSICAALQFTIPITTETSYIGYPPRIIFIEVTFLNAYIILNYSWWSTLKKRTKQTYGIVGCLMCLTAGVLVIIDREMSAVSGDATIAQDNITSRAGELQRKKHANTMATVGFLAFWEAILHFLDVIIGSY